MISESTDRRAVNDFFSTLYKHLKREAARQLWFDRNATINPTGLVNAAYLKMADVPGFGAMPESQKRGIVAHAIHEVLVEAARRRRAAKRDVPVEPLLAEPVDGRMSAEQVLAIQFAIEKLEQRNPRHARIVEMKCTLGMEMGDIAEALEVSKTTVEREWRNLKAWLNRELSTQK